MSFQDQTNLAYSTIPSGGAPSPAASGNSLKVASASDRDTFPTPPFMATLWPAGVTPTLANAEIVQFNNTTGTDGFVIARAQGGTTAKNVTAGWQVAATITTMPFSELQDAFVVTVAPSGIPAKYNTDGTADDVEIQAAIDEVALAGGGTVFIRQGHYQITNTLVVPFDPKIRLVGEKIAKQNLVGTTLKVSGTLTSLIEMVGPSDPVDNTGLTHDLHFQHLTLNGSNTTTNIFRLVNQDYVVIDFCRIIGATNSITTVWDSASDPIASTVPGGIFLSNSIVSANSGVGIDLQFQTQCWISSCWFTGSSVSKWINFKSCSKIHLINCEFNTANIGLCFQDTATVSCNNITAVGCVFEVGSGKKAWQDERTNTGSTKVSITGCTTGSGVIYDSLVNGNNTVVTGNEVRLGSLNTGATSKTSAYSLIAGDDIVIADATSAVMATRLPTAVGVRGRQHGIKRINAGGNPVIVATTLGQSIDGGNTLSLDSQYAAIRVASDDSNWKIISQMGTVNTFTTSTSSTSTSSTSKSTSTSSTSSSVSTSSTSSSTSTTVIAFG